MHLESIAEGLELNEYVSEGQQIGTLGDTGESKEKPSSSHLHYELFIDGERVNPAGKDGQLRDPQKIMGGDNNMYYAPPLQPLTVIGISKHVRKMILLDINMNLNLNQLIYLEIDDDQ